MGEWESGFKSQSRAGQGTGQGGNERVRGTWYGTCLEAFLVPVPFHSVLALRSSKPGIYLQDVPTISSKLRFHGGGLTEGSPSRAGIHVICNSTYEVHNTK